MKLTTIDGTLRLTNNGSLEMFFLGTGSAFVKKNFQNNAIVIKGKDHLLIDCGSQCPGALTSYNLSVLNIQNVFATHSHSDHIGGMEELALMHRYVDKTRPRILITDEYKKLLWEESLKGGLSYGENRPTPYNAGSPGGYLTFDDYFEQIHPTLLEEEPRPLWEANVGSINIKFFRTMHMPDSVPSWRESAWSTGVLIDNRILFPGDTRFDRELLEYMQKKYNIEWIFHDVQGYTGGVHAGIEELKTLDAETKKKMILCHYADNFASYDAKADGFAALAKRGMYYDFGMSEDAASGQAASEEAVTTAIESPVEKATATPQAAATAPAIA
ncbi:MAG: MBL fold metallo-hydrolase [Treponema sp.]|nr:MBL fold metallo-hydrolase [Treponema sp.]